MTIINVLYIEGGVMWGEKGEEYRPDKCAHKPDDGCMWCCQKCNYDTHWCPGCGTVTDHKETVCGDCGQSSITPLWHVNGLGYIVKSGC